MRVLLSSFGSAGDVRPLLLVARALADAGHEAVCVLDPAWCGVARSEFSLVAVESGDAWDPGSIARRPEWLDPKRGSVRMLRELVIPRTRGLVEAVRRVAADQKPDAIIGHHISFGLPWVARELGVPWIMCAVAPSSWPSVEDPNLYPGMPDRDRYPRWTIRLGTAIAGRMIGRAIDPPINAVRRELGLPAQRNTMLEDQFSDCLNLGLWSEHYRGPASDDPPKSVIVGFSTSSASGDVEADLADRIGSARDGGARTAVWSLGTTAVHAGRVHRDGFIEAARCAGIVPVVLTGDGARAAELSERGVIAAAYAPHGALFPLVDMVVHHGGMGTTAAALRAGVPSIVLPFTHDQPDNARRLRRLGLAEVVRTRDRGPERFEGALVRLFGAVDDSTLRDRARRFASQLAAESFEERVVRAVEGAV